MSAERNWAGNITYSAQRWHRPQSTAEIAGIVRGAKKLRAVGSRHSFNTIADSDEDLVFMQGLNRVIAIDPAARTVTVEAGITYGELSPVLEAAGFALHNLASLPHISVVGAVMTATHGSGNANGNLATQVVGLKLVTASGDTVSFVQGQPGFDGAVVSLGALGIVTEVTLRIVPSFAVRQNLFMDLPVQTLIDSFDAITGAAYSVSCFTAWRGDSIDHVWLKNLASAPIPGHEFFGAQAASRPYHPITALDPTPCTAQMGVPGPWYLRLPHFRMEFQPSAGAELQTEYFVPRAQAPAAITALRTIQDRIAPHLMISEIRTMAADDFWLSGAYGRDTVGFHFTWQQDWPAVRAVLPAIEAALAPFAVRPHWGKLFTMARDTALATYPRLADFRALAARLDPEGKFRNAFLADHLL